MKYVNIIVISLLTGVWCAPTPPRSLDLTARSGGTLPDGSVKRLSMEGRQSGGPSLGGFNGWIRPPVTGGGKKRDVNLGYKKGRQVFSAGLMATRDIEHPGPDTGLTKREANGDVVPAHKKKRQLLGGLGGGLESDSVTGAANRRANGYAGAADKGKRQPPPPSPPPPPAPEPAPSDSTRRGVKLH